MIISLYESVNFYPDQLGRYYLICVGIYKAISDKNMFPFILAFNFAGD